MMLNDLIPSIPSKHSHQVLVSHTQQTDGHDNDDLSHYSRKQWETEIIMKQKNVISLKVCSDLTLFETLCDKTSHLALRREKTGFLHMPK